MARGDVETGWSDAGPIPGDPDWAGGTVFTERHEIEVAAPPAEVFAAVARVGGETGWYGADWLWRARGAWTVWPAARAPAGAVLPVHRLVFGRMLQAFAGPPKLAAGGQARLCPLSRRASGPCSPGKREAQRHHGLPQIALRFFEGVRFGHGGSHGLDAR